MTNFKITFISQITNFLYGDQIKEDTTFWSENLMRIHHLVHPGVDVRMILKWQSPDTGCYKHNNKHSGSIQDGK
jgi:hypothetical protein